MDYAIKLLETRLGYKETELRLLDAKYYYGEEKQKVREQIEQLKRAIGMLWREHNDFF